MLSHELNGTLFKVHGSDDTWYRSCFLASLNSEALLSLLAINVQTDIYSQNTPILSPLKVKVAVKSPLFTVSWNYLG
jgi:hypothetical protein